MKDSDNQLFKTYCDDKTAGDWHTPFQNYCAGYEAAMANSRPAQPAQEPAETVTLVGIKDGIETVLGTVSTPPEMKAREIIRNYGWNPDDQDDFGEGETAMCIINDLLAWIRRQGAPKIELAAPTQQALSDDEILNCFYASKSEGMVSYMLAVGRAIEAHCRGGADK